MGSTWSDLDITALGRQEQWKTRPRATPKPRHTTGGCGTTITEPIPSNPALMTLRAAQSTVAATTPIHRDAPESK